MNEMPASPPLLCPACGYDVTSLLGDEDAVCTECGGAISRETCNAAPGGSTRADLVLLGVVALVCALMGAVLYLLLRYDPDAGKVFFFGDTPILGRLFTPMQPPPWPYRVFIYGVMFLPFSITTARIVARIQRRRGALHTRGWCTALLAIGITLILGVHVATIVLLK